MNIINKSGDLIVRNRNIYFIDTWPKFIFLLLFMILWFLSRSYFPDYSDFIKQIFIAIIIINLVINKESNSKLFIYIVSLLSALAIILDLIFMKNTHIFEFFMVIILIFNFRKE